MVANSAHVVECPASLIEGRGDTPRTPTGSGAMAADLMRDCDLLHLPKWGAGLGGDGRIF